MPSTRYSEKCPSFLTTWFIAWVPRMPSAPSSGETRATTERLSASDATPGTSEWPQTKQTQATRTRRRAAGIPRRVLCVRLDIASAAPYASRTDAAMWRGT